MIYDVTCCTLWHRKQSIPGGKIFHMSVLVAVQKSDGEDQWGIGRYIHSSLCVF